MTEKFEKLPKCFKYLLSRVYYNGKIYDNITSWYESLDKKSGNFELIINPIVSKQIKITVSKGALEDSPFYPFNQIYNNNNPMPKETMIGNKIEDGGNMVKMDLWDETHKIHWIGWILKSKILKEEEL